MEDIADMVGVSVSTVSRALAGSSRVGEQTRQRIAEAVEATGYVVHHGARVLRLQQARQILVMVPNLASPFFPEIVLGIEQEVDARGFGVVIGNTSYSAEKEERLASQLLTGAIDGLIVMTGRKPNCIAGANLDRVVAVGRPIPASKIPCISIDDRAAARDAIGHLLALGHRRIAHLAGPPGTSIIADRVAGVGDALAEAGLELAALEPAGDYQVASGHAAMSRMIGNGLRATAVFCAGDLLAIGAIRAAREAGFRVPEDMSFVGFDDLTIAGAYEPSLTTIRQPRGDMGKVAAALMLELIAGAKPVRKKRIILKHELVVRESSAPVARPIPPADLFHAS